MRTLMFPNTFPSGMKTAPEKSPGAVSTGSGDRIRTCDLWVMSQPVAVSSRAVRLICAGHEESPVPTIAPRLLIVEAQGERPDNERAEESQNSDVDGKHAGDQEHRDQRDQGQYLDGSHDELSLWRWDRTALPGWQWPHPSVERGCSVECVDAVAVIDAVGFCGVPANRRGENEPIQRKFAVKPSNSISRQAIPRLSINDPPRRTGDISPVLGSGAPPIRQCLGTGHSLLSRAVSADQDATDISRSAPAHRCPLRRGASSGAVAVRFRGQAKIDWDDRSRALRRQVTAVHQWVR